jgi:hypothetical protein
LRFLTDTQRGSTRREVAEEGEGTLVKAAAKLLVTAGEEVPVKKLETSPWIYKGEEIDRGMADLDLGSES